MITKILSVCVKVTELFWKLGAIVLALLGIGYLARFIYDSFPVSLYVILGIVALGAALHFMKDSWFENLQKVVSIVGASLFGAVWVSMMWIICSQAWNEHDYVPFVGFTSFGLLVVGIYSNEALKAALKLHAGEK
jgi:ABC-type iron transport system FetAB permease component